MPPPGAVIFVLHAPAVGAGIANSCLLRNNLFFALADEHPDEPESTGYTDHKKIP